jgi:4'-phosphopantetheinyl transferase
VDVEAIRPLPNLDRLSRRFCSAREQNWLYERSPMEREAAFLTLWTCKESYLKAVGAGVAMPLREIDADPEASRLTAIAGDPTTAAEWTLLRADLPEPAVCTVAVRGQGWKLSVREHRWSSKGMRGMHAKSAARPPTT